MFWIAWDSRSGSGGWNAVRFCLSQPSGVVRTTSSNSRGWSELAIPSLTRFSVRGAVDLPWMAVTTVLRRMVAPSRAGRATDSRILR